MNAMAIEKRADQFLFSITEKPSKHFNIRNGSERQVFQQF